MHSCHLLTSIKFGLLRKDFLSKVCWIGVYVAGWRAISSPYFQMSSFLPSRLTLNFYLLRHCNFILNNWKHLGVIFTRMFTTGVCICPCSEVFVWGLPLPLRFTVNLQHCLISILYVIWQIPGTLWSPGLSCDWALHVYLAWREAETPALPAPHGKQHRSSSELEAIALSCRPDISHTMSFCRGKQNTQGWQDWHSNCGPIPVAHIGPWVCPILQVHFDFPW